MVPSGISSPLQEMIPIFETASAMTIPSNLGLVFGCLGDLGRQFLDDRPSFFAQRGGRAEVCAPMPFHRVVDPNPLGDLPARQLDILLGAELRAAVQGNARSLLDLLPGFGIARYEQGQAHRICLLGQQLVGDVVDRLAANQPMHLADPAARDDQDLSFARYCRPSESPRFALSGGLGRKNQLLHFLQARHPAGDLDLAVDHQARHHNDLEGHDLLDVLDLLDQRLDARFLHGLLGQFVERLALRASGSKDLNNHCESLLDKDFWFDHDFRLHRIGDEAVLLRRLQGASHAGFDDGRGIAAGRHANQGAEMQPGEDFRCGPVRSTWCPPCGTRRKAA